MVPEVPGHLAVEGKRKVRSGDSRPWQAVLPGIAHYQAGAKCVAWYYVLPGPSKMCCLVFHVARPEQDVLPGITCCKAMQQEDLQEESNEGSQTLQQITNETRPSRGV